MIKTIPYVEAPPHSVLVAVHVDRSSYIYSGLFVGEAKLNLLERHKKPRVILNAEREEFHTAIIILLTRQRTSIEACLQWDSLHVVAWIGFTSLLRVIYRHHTIQDSHITCCPGIAHHQPHRAEFEADNRFFERICGMRHWIR
jgi:hypothetical protein